VRQKILATIRKFRWPQWLILAAFLVVLCFTGLHAVRTARDASYWRHHREEPIRGWMTVGYVAHSYRVPPHVLYEALGLPPKPPDKRPLRRIARSQNLTMDQVRAALQEAILHARPNSPPASASPTPEKAPDKVLRKGGMP
jgi:hypothetical protein